MSIVKKENHIDFSDNDWKSLRIKDLITKIGSGVTPKGGGEVYVDNGVTFIRSQNVYNDGLRLDKVSFITDEVNNRMKNSQLKPFDILINITGASIGRTCVFPISVGKANINQHIIYLRIKKRKVDFLSYYLKSQFVKDYIMSVQAGSSKEALNMGQTLNIPVSIPNPEMQTKIASYLEVKTEAIDEKVALLENKIDKYKDFRKSLINQTITKGLITTVKLKDSKIDWIGEIPEHWKVKRMKDIGFLYSGLSGKSAKDFNQDDKEDNKSFLTFTNIAGNTYINTNDFGKVIIKENEKQNKIKQNDLFFLMSSEGYEDVGKASLLVDNVSDTYLNSFCKGFRLTTKNVVPKFLNWMLYAPIFRERLLIQGKGFTRINLKMEKINDFNLIIPSTTKEQIEIANFLDLKTTSIDNIITNIKKQINLLKELRKTLINDVVNGKLKVIEE
ncbi:restriction endonuclease subunit S [Formosa sp. PL04]|uniref:restriction endonuclease subunit S n=1 Tax=Formosa sp. PL04 TaxID=3081755 RepID=UPI002980CE1A|nr:restriction endonuclease subunit S [Formosa sp. PL04]MDW5288718.1 restriction endonuclease subunit S [Formosa sp. PL04]